MRTTLGNNQDAGPASSFFIVFYKVFRTRPNLNINYIITTTTEIRGAPGLLIVPALGAHSNFNFPDPHTPVYDNTTRACPPSL